MDLGLIFSKAEEKERSYQDYLYALEEERKKIQVFHRELPLSLHLVTYAIESCRRQIAAELFPPRADFRSGHEDEELISDGAPALEEFIPMKLNSSTPEADDEESGDTAMRKRDWLKSVQLWTPHPSEEDDFLGRRTSPPLHSSLSSRRSGPFQEPVVLSVDAQPVPASSPPPQTASSTSETRGMRGSSSSGADEKRPQTHRKTRRCWSQELHHRFLDALHQLGGTEEISFAFAAPMHTSQGNSGNAQHQQVVFVGGIWVPSSDYTATIAAATERRPTAKQAAAGP
ncbi:unnamed protein product [Spirodela intermedia]|uniref:HHO5-like N-terminal domain-containing protein n=1 Tax=Spirodela intermedia TaxID=51605 RepID=A0A7I8JSP8_SPIIN|nr:unnamed protein product [Spirodela intermedia]CAA6673149.1 unnamed protein product [Spirodela intermedia]